ncbi:hypothetical protein [Photobacterium leiognathi]|uniref:hypothetical protein n=1 Tax=Photobacterium leiognathi TaxID=553611 RepID=UPI002982A759|nr:hypothetical protein [Photobacterium leiognathi]
MDKKIIEIGTMPDFEDNDNDFKEIIVTSCDNEKHKEYFIKEHLIKKYKSFSIIHLGFDLSTWQHEIFTKKITDDRHHIFVLDEYISKKSFITLYLNMKASAFNQIVNLSNFTAIPYINCYDTINDEEIKAFYIVTSLKKIERTVRYFKALQSTKVINSKIIFVIRLPSKIKDEDKIKTFNFINDVLEISQDVRFKMI